MTEVEKKLSEYRTIKRAILETETRIQELESKKEQIYDMLLSAKPIENRVQGGELYDPIFNAVAQLVDVYAERIKKLAANLAALYARLNNIEITIERAGLSAVERQYVTLRYFKGLPVWRVAHEIGYSERSAQRLRKNALNKLIDAQKKIS